MRNSRRTRNGFQSKQERKHPVDAFVKALLAKPELKEAFGMALLDDLYHDETGAWNDRARRVLGPIVGGGA